MCAGEEACRPPIELKRRGISNLSTPGHGPAVAVVIQYTDLNKKAKDITCCYFYRIGSTVWSLNKTKENCRIV
jgi:hypothetical protein